MFKIIRVIGIELEVHDDGTIYSAPSTSSYGTFRPRRLKRQTNDRGYRQIGLYGSNKVLKTIRVHRIVAQAFLGDWNPGLVVDHIDLDKANNNVSNLRMVTHGENARLYHEEQMIKAGIPHRGLSNNGYKNVSRAARGRFMAQMRINGRRLSNGTAFYSQIDAACAVNELCVKHDQPLHRFNIPLKAERVRQVRPHMWFANWNSASWGEKQA